MKPRLYLVDAHAFLHRAYHALPPLSNSRGEPVGALYGFARMLLQLLKRESPEGVAVCFDSPGPTFRHEAYKEYKATRKEIDEDLLRQLKEARGMAEAMGFACAELPGYEADDLMATLARRAAGEGYDSVLVTGDKDALQMVGPGVRVLKDVTGGVWMDEPQVLEKLGVSPRAVVDFLALTGDASDNVPGVRGIGPVGAAKLLNRFGDLEGALRAAKAQDPEIPPKTAQALVEGEKNLRSALFLLRLRSDVPVPLRPSDCRSPDLRQDRMAEVFARLEFHSLLKEIGGPAPAGRGASAPGSSRGPQMPEARGGVALAEREEPGDLPRIRELPFKELRAELSQSPVVAVTALRNEARDLVESSRAFLALGLEDGRAALLDEAQVKSVKAEISGILRGKSLKAGYDLKETLAALELLGLELSGPLFDTMLAAYCLSPVRPKEDGGEGGWRELLLRRVAKALGRERLREGMKEAGVLKLYEELELPLVAILRGMEREGIALDEPYLRGLSREFEARIASLKAELDRMAGMPINVNSPKQLGELLFDRLGLPEIHKTAKGGRSTDEEALQALARSHPIPAKVLEYRELAKLQSTYVDGLLERLDPGTGRVHTRFDQTGTETGRLSSLNPNLQNIPVRTALGQKIRRAFVSRKGWVLVSADYSQIDLRVLAHVSGDRVLKEAFSRNEDVHLRTACEVFRVPPESVDAEMRRRAKAVNFGIVYGQTPFGLAAELGISQTEAADIIRRYFERYQGVAEWLEKNLETARSEGLVRTFLGRIRHLPGLSARNTALRQFSERAARNTPIQGGSADIIKLAMLEVHKGLSGARPPAFKARMLLQIHDELLFEAPKAEVAAFSRWVRGSMERACSLSVPLLVDVKAGPDWRDMEAVKA